MSIPRKEESALRNEGANLKEGVGIGVGIDSLSRSQKGLTYTSSETRSDRELGGAYCTPLYGAGSNAEVRKLSKSELRTVQLHKDHGQLVLATFHSGWKWRTDVQPQVKTDWCDHAHFGVCISGSMQVNMQNGTSQLVKSGQSFWIPPGHDGEVVGNEPCVMLDATGCNASYGLREQSEEYVKGVAASSLARLPLTVKDFSQSDQVISYPNAEIRVSRFGEDIGIAKIVGKPGWRWTKDAKPKMGTELCERAHTGIMLSGQETIRQSNGVEINIDARNGPVMFECEPGHDSWIVGKEDVLAYDVTPMDMTKIDARSSLMEKDYKGVRCIPVMGSGVEVKQMPKAELRSLKLNHGRGELVVVTFQPGWNWRKDWQAQMKTDWCTHSHFGIVLSGSMTVVMSDGTKKLMRAGQTFFIPAEHDAWVEGNEPAVLLDAAGCHTSCGSSQESDKGERGEGASAAAASSGASSSSLHGSLHSTLPFIVRDFAESDKVISMQHGEARILTMSEGMSIGRLHAKKGWRWVTDVKPIAGTEWCEHTHIGILTSGQQQIRLRSGYEYLMDATSGIAFFELESGHDAWQVGEGDVIAYDLNRMVKHYAQIQQQPQQSQQPRSQSQTRQ